jgi:hypothetical protein
MTRALRSFEICHDNYPTGVLTDAFLLHCSAAGGGHAENLHDSHPVVHRHQNMRLQVLRHHVFAEHETKDGLRVF